MLEDEIQKRLKEVSTLPPAPPGKFRPQEHRGALLQRILKNEQQQKTPQRRQGHGEILPATKVEDSYAKLLRRTEAHQRIQKFKRNTPPQ